MTYCAALALAYSGYKIITGRYGIHIVIFVAAWLTMASQGVSV